MVNQGQIIGENLRALRNQRQLSLGQLAELCDVSKVVLSQIERGEANPTVNTIWKIAAGLKVPYTELLDNKREQNTVIRREDAIVQTALDGSYESRVYFRVSSDCSLDLFTVELCPGARYESQGHLPGSKEYLMVNKGQGRVLVEREEFALGAGDCLRFDGDKRHVYLNEGDEPLSCTSIVYY